MRESNRRFCEAKSVPGLLGWFGFLGLLGSLICVKPAAAFIVINEILADPAAGLAGDANGDGIRSSNDDEFVEILNYGDSAEDLSGWKIRDGASSRHIFPVSTTLLPYEYLVVFGGGLPSLPGVNWQLASTGILSLNNGGDTVSLLNPVDVTMDQVIYGGEGNNDQSLVRFPEGTGTGFVLHTSLPESGGALFSPGRSIDGEPLFASQNLQSPATIPEPLTLAYFVFGGLGLWMRGRASDN